MSLVPAEFPKDVEKALIAVLRVVRCPCRGELDTGGVLEFSMSPHIQFTSFTYIARLETRADCRKCGQRRRLYIASRRSMKDNRMIPFTIQDTESLGFGEIVFQDGYLYQLV